MPDGDFAITKPNPIPVTVFTGFLGAGKTSLILSLLPRLPKDYKVVLLKNEFGDVEVDSQLAKQSSLTAVSEILNGCICCVMVGLMKNAILEIREKYRPDRIIIETSGSAFPATLAFQIRELAAETGNDIYLDAILTVIDAENFTGYEDTSVTAKMQAQYSDVLLINKWENVSERALDIVMDHLFTLNDTTPKVKVPKASVSADGTPTGGVDPLLVFGLDSQLFLLDDKHHHHEEHEHSTPGADHHEEVETTSIISTTPTTDDEPSSSSLTRETLEKALAILPKESVWRVKGFLRISSSATSTEPPSTYILNWAFGRFELTPFLPPASTPKQSSPASSKELTVRLTIMGEQGEVRKWAKRLADALQIQVA